jgi:16S rRNA (guanine966-N2)-methyltransferase
MRIVGGDLRSRKIKSPPASAARPTKDRVREAVFNMIAAKVGGSSVLDLFAGSGAYGLEALSRGAKACIFVDSNPDCTSVILENASSLGVGEKSEVIRRDAFEFIEDTGMKNRKFDVIFADPPYRAVAHRNILIMINRYDILGDSGLLIAEHDPEEDIPGSYGDVSIYKQKSYGITSISVFKRK